MKCQSLFPGYIKKKNINLSCAELAQIVVKVKSLLIHQKCIMYVSRSIDTHHQYHDTESLHKISWYIDVFDDTDPGLMHNYPCKPVQPVPLIDCLFFYSTVSLLSQDGSHRHLVDIISVFYHQHTTLWKLLPNPCCRQRCRYPCLQCHRIW